MSAPSPEVARALGSHHTAARTNKELVQYIESRAVPQAPIPYQDPAVQFYLYNNIDKILDTGERAGPPGMIHCEVLQQLLLPLMGQLGDWEVELTLRSGSTVATCSLVALITGRFDTNVVCYAQLANVSVGSFKPIRFNKEPSIPYGWHRDLNGMALSRALTVVEQFLRRAWPSQFVHALCEQVLQPLQQIADDCGSDTDTLGHVAKMLFDTASKGYCAAISQAGRLRHMPVPQFVSPSALQQARALYSRIKQSNRPSRAQRSEQSAPKRQKTDPLSKARTALFKDHTTVCIQHALHKAGFNTACRNDADCQRPHTGQAFDAAVAAATHFRSGDQ